MIQSNLLMLRLISLQISVNYVSLIRLPKLFLCGLTELVQRVGSERGHTIEIKNIENPRKEAEEHYYNPTYQGLMNLGAEPQKLTDEVLHGIFETVEKYIANVRSDVIFRGIKWN